MPVVTRWGGWAGVACALAISSARAEIQEVSVPFTGSGTDHEAEQLGSSGNGQFVQSAPYADTVSVPGFDTQGGTRTLLSVEVEASYDFSATFSFQSTVPFPPTGVATVCVQDRTLSAPGLNASLPACVSFDQPIAVPPFATAQIVFPGTISYAAAVSTDASAYADAATVAVQLSGSLSVTKSVPADVLYPEDSFTRSGTVTVRYEYSEAPPACRADFDSANGVQVADIFAFLRAWFANDPSADFDGENGIQVADIFAFLRAWFAGC